MPSGRSTSCRALAAEPVRQNANGTYDIDANRESHRGQRWLQNTSIRVPGTVGLQYISCYVALHLGVLTIAYIIMTMRAFIRNIAGGDSVVDSMVRCFIFGVLRLPIRPCDEWPPVMYGHFCLLPLVANVDYKYSRTRYCRPTIHRAPVMYGHFCLVPRVSVHDRYYCTPITGHQAEYWSCPGYLELFNQCAPHKYYLNKDFRDT